MHFTVKLVPIIQFEKFIADHLGMGPNISLGMPKRFLHARGHFLRPGLTFGPVDKVGNVHVFNIGGNKYRLVVSMAYTTQRCYIQAIMTHARDWQKSCWSNISSRK